MKTILILTKEEVKKMIKESIEKRIIPLEKEIDILRIRVNDLEKLI